MEEEWKLQSMYQMKQFGALKCSGIQKCLSKTVDFVCRKCFDFTSNAEDDGNGIVNGNVIEKVTKFSYFKRCP